MIAAAFDEAGARDPGHLRTWVVLVDGAEHQLALIRAEAARRGVTIHVIIDIIHVLEYIWGAARSLHAAGDPAAEDWVAARALAVLAGDSQRAAAQITAEADAASLDASRRSGADACVRYLGNKRQFLRYDQALDAGWPIATANGSPAARSTRTNTTSASPACEPQAPQVPSNGPDADDWHRHSPLDSTAGSSPPRSPRWRTPRRTPR